MAKSELAIAVGLSVEKKHYNLVSQKFKLLSYVAILSLDKQVASHTS
jgi:hypothetical protein